MKIFDTLVKVEEWRGKLKIIINNYNPKLIAEIKGMEGKFELTNIWTIKDTPRNRFTLDLISGGEYNGYYKLYSSKSELQSDELLELWKHQKEAFQFKITRRRVIDAGEMGVGKTLSTIRAIQKLNFHPVWWIGPNSALTSLRTQIRKWGNPFQQGDRVFNYHSLEFQMEQVSIPPQLVVFDEGHALKNPSARRTQLAIQLSTIMEQYYGKECALFILTGTPSPQNYFDWWSLCEIVRPGWLKESSYNKYKYRIANFERGERIDGGSFPSFQNWHNHDNNSKKQCKDVKCEVCSILPKRLKGLILITWKKDCLDLPEKVYEEILLAPSTSTLRVARAIPRMVDRAIAAQLRLRQLSDGFQYLDDGTTLQGETPKDTALTDLLEEYFITKRIVIYAAFTASVDRCVAICIKAGWNVWRYDGRGQAFFGVIKEITETIFQKEDDDIPIAFVGNPEAAGQGLTLTPAPAIIYYSNSFKSTFRVQSEDRIHRPGASKIRGCKIIDLIHLPTDKLILNRLKEKRDAEIQTLQEIMQILS